tara:strand:- start:1213 stop:1395 length:183 start_codon:yes stop_codon:yes gene_type:complete
MSKYSKDFEFGFGTFAWIVTTIWWSGINALYLGDTLTIAYGVVVFFVGLFLSDGSMQFPG